LDAFVKVHRGQNKRCVTRVNTSVLNVLTDSVYKNRSVRGNTIAVNLLSAIDVLGDDDRMVWRDGGSSKQLLLQLILTSDDCHSSTGEDVRWADEDRVSDRFGKLLRLFVGRKLFPGWLIHANRVEN
jgi:hypothetical protein